MQKELFKQYLSQFSTSSCHLKQVILTDELNKQGHPVRAVQQFSPQQTIICWVELTASGGLFGVRWFHDDRLIFQDSDRLLLSYGYAFIQSTPQVTLPEGTYRIEIYLTNDLPQQVVHFTVKRYKPMVRPVISIPDDHQNLEDSPLVTVPFAFDEQWQIGETGYTINRVQVVLENETDIYVSVVVQIGLNPGQLTSYQTKRICESVAHYALIEGYISQARRLEIDGQHYTLEDLICVCLVNREAGVIPGIGQVPIRRMMFELKDLDASKG